MSNIKQIILRAILCSFMLVIAGVTAMAQITLTLNNRSMREVIKEIEKISEYRFFYNNDLVGLDKRISVMAENADIGNVLEQISRQSGVSYVIKDNDQIVLSSGQTVSRQIGKKITGVVTDSKGEPIIGANVVEKGTTNGIITDIDGKFSLEMADNGVLQVSYIGYNTRELSVKDKNQFQIQLTEDTKALDEVVVIGYGTQNKRDLTSSISSVKSDVLRETPAANVQQALSGKVSGVQIISNSNEPGGTASIRIRGVGTVNNNEPLCIIDGIPVSGGMNSVNPGDIESIEILKDASALAIYGARAQNGVVIISTKKGEKGRVRVNFESWIAANVISKNVDMMSGKEWAQYYQETAKESEYDIDGGNPATLAWLEDVAQHGGKEYDWFDEGTRTGFTQNYQLGINGGNDFSTYMLSLNYMNQKGIMINSDQTRYSLRFNSDHKITSWLKIGNTFQYLRNEVNNSGSGDPNQATSNDGNNIMRLLIANPMKTIYNESGGYAGKSDFVNPILDNNNMHQIWWMKELQKNNRNNRALGSLYANLTFMEGFDFKSSFSVDIQDVRNYQFVPFNDIEGQANRPQSQSSLSILNKELITWYVDNTLTFKRKFHKHDITAMVGYQAQKTTNTYETASGSNFANNKYPYFNTAGNTKDYQFSSNGKDINAWVSYFGRVLYAYDDKYLLTATVRRDASSRFGSTNRWGTFPAFSVGWRLGEEEFMKSISWLSNLKLRAGWGVTGGEGAGDYQFLGSIGSGDAYNYAFNDVMVSGSTLLRLPNALLRWEETKQMDIGLDASILNNRVDFVLDYFKRNTTNMFLGFAPALESGLESNPTGNLGEVQNSGFEIGITSRNVRTKDFSWESNLNMTFLKNQVLSLAADGADRYNGHNITRVGEEIGALYGLKTDGIFQNWNEVYEHAYQKQAVLGTDPQTGLPIYNKDSQNKVNYTAPGDIRFVDFNGDGRIDPATDQTVIGSTIPDLTWGFMNTFTYKNIEMSVFFQGVHGVNVWNGLRSAIETQTGPANASASLLNRWVGEGTSNEIPRSVIGDPNQNGQASERWVENASYVKLQNLKLAYNFPESFLRKLEISRLQVYGTVTNVFTITGYKGFDPEVGLRSEGNSETAGVDNGVYPNTRQFTFGLNIYF